MPRFHFNIRDGADYFPDQEGYELPDLACAHRAALKTLRQTIRDSRTLPDDGQCFEIADPQGQIVLTVSFKDALSVPDSAL